MTRVELSRLARAELHHLIVTRNAPEDEVWARVEAAIDQLSRYPVSGQIALGDRYLRARALNMAWGWLCCLYLYDEAADVVSIASFFDVRTLGAPVIGTG